MLVAAISKPILRRVALPLFDAALGGADAEFGSRAFSVHWFTREKIGVVVHHGISLIDAQRIQRVNKLGGELMHQRVREFGGFESVWGVEVAAESKLIMIVNLPGDGS